MLRCDCLRRSWGRGLRTRLPRALRWPRSLGLSRGARLVWGWGLGAALILAAPAGARAQGLSLGQHDSSLPIEITADRLDVIQPDRVAIFTGKVDAVQGDLVLSADKLKVFYSGNQPGQQGQDQKGQDQKGQDQGQQDAAPAAAGGSSIRRIEAEGNVFLSSPRQTAQGKTGVYDVASNQLNLDGSVVLTQGDDVIRGDRLEVDLTSGQSRVLAALPSNQGGTPPQRVRALFTPQPKAPAAGPAAAAAAAQAQAATAAKPKATE